MRICSHQDAFLRVRARAHAFPCLLTLTLPLNMLKHTHTLLPTSLLMLLPCTHTCLHLRTCTSSLRRCTQPSCAATPALTCQLTHQHSLPFTSASTESLRNTRKAHTRTQRTRFALAALLHVAAPTRKATFNSAVLLTTRTVRHVRGLHAKRRVARGAIHRLMKLALHVSIRSSEVPVPPTVSQGPFPAHFAEKLFPIPWAGRGTSAKILLIFNTYRIFSRRTAINTNLDPHALNAKAQLSAHI